MAANRFELTAREVFHLLDQQVAAIAGRKLGKFTRIEANAYQARRRRIFKLRSALSRFHAPA
jgi:hypothetical protein